MNAAVIPSPMALARTSADADPDAAELAAAAAAHAPRAVGWSDPSSFLMDHDLLVRGAAGVSILRLPWFEEDLFVGRPLPDIGEMPTRVRNEATESYREALAGTRGRFRFTSYGHAYTVDSIPVRGADGRVLGVLGVAHAERRAPRGLTREPLTPREIEVMQLSADGLTGPDIAEHLVVSPGTVKTHFQNIYMKWNVRDRAAAVAEAMRQGLID
jgi:DNA-binding CsgD family transcriptional regulator